MTSAEIHGGSEEIRMAIAENYDRLAKAIVHQAINEYKAELRRAAERIKGWKESEKDRKEKEPDSEEREPGFYSPKMKELESFFRSDWFVVLCDMEGQAVIDDLRGSILPNMKGKKE